MSDGWPGDASPYHAGEQAVQLRAGGRDIAERVGRRVIRDHMPDQHRTFFAELSYAFLGAADPDGRPWATALTGEPGFLHSPDPRLLTVAGLPARDDPARRGLSAGATVALVGIGLDTRRRNRLTGRVARIGPEGFDIAIDQSFGNCPQYINARAPLARLPSAPVRVDPVAPDDPWIARLLADADTGFLASATARRDSAVEGSDVNHRGGPPGFLRAEVRHGRLALTLPDYPGNRAFSNFGNIAVHPRAGLLVPDFATGDALSLTGTALILWSGTDRQLCIDATELVRLRGLLPAPWTRAEPAPQFVRFVQEHPVSAEVKE